MTPSGNWNTTYNGAVVMNSIDGGTMIMIAICIVGVVALLLLLTSLERYTKFFDNIGKLVFTLKYTGFGVGITAAGYGLYLVCNFIAKAGAGIDPILIVEVIGVYVVLTIVGYIAEKTYHKIRAMHHAYTEAKKGELIPVS